MTYDFDEIIDRHRSNSVKWDLCPDPDVIPMWIADMDFKAASFIMDAIRNRVEHGIFGYTHVPDDYYRSVINWFSRRRGWNIKKEWIRYISGLVPGISVCIQAFTEPGDKVILNSPTYNCFFSCAQRNSREISASSLIYRTDTEVPTYMMDFDDLERRCADPRAKLMVLCNPQNPAGRVWTTEELKKVGEICRRHGVTVVSDEIHCELEMPGYRYTPFASISEENQQCSVTLCSPTKPFNLAGLQISNIIASDPAKMARIMDVISSSEHLDVNPIGVEALKAAYSPEGEEWLRQLNSYIFGNWNTLREMLSKDLPGFTPVRLEGTYLAWVDCHALTERGISTKTAMLSMIEKEKVWVNEGAMYGDGNFMRVNLACPDKTLREGVRRMICGLDRLMRS